MTALSLKLGQGGLLGPEGGTIYLPTNTPPHPARGLPDERFAERPPSPRRPGGGAGPEAASWIRPLPLSGGKPKSPLLCFCPMRGLDGPESSLGTPPLAAFFLTKPLSPTIRTFAILTEQRDPRGWGGGHMRSGGWTPPLYRGHPPTGLRQLRHRQNPL